MELAGGKKFKAKAEQGLKQVLGVRIGAHFALQVWVLPC